MTVLDALLITRDARNLRDGGRQRTPAEIAAAKARLAESRAEADERAHVEAVRQAERHYPDEEESQREFVKQWLKSRRWPCADDDLDDVDTDDDDNEED